MIRATFEREIYHNNDFDIVLYRAVGENGKPQTAIGKGGRFSASGHDLPKTPNVVFTLEGTWKASKYGDTLCISAYDMLMPTSEDGIVAYLKGLGCGIGVRKAAAIYDYFGESIWNVLETDPQQLKAVKGISNKIITGLAEKLRTTRQQRELMQLFKGSDITPKQINKLIENCADAQEDVMDLIQHDPFRICDVKGFGFVTADRLARALNHPPDDPKRLIASIDSIFSDAAAAGHSCLPKLELIARMKTVLNRGYASNTVSEDAIKRAVNQAFIQNRVAVTGDYIYDRMRYAQETSIANDICRLLKHKNSPIEGIDEFITDYEKDNFELADSQKEAVRNAFRHQVSIITGGPGTGKTTVIKAVLFAHKMVFGLKSQPMLLAPTGRAARRMSETTGYDASTIHLAIGFTGDDADIETSEQFPANLIIVDEASMMDQYIASVLFQKIRSNTRVVIVGDPDQLPSVGCGNVLHEMIRSQKVPTTKLDVIFRQANDNPIVANADSIKHGNAELLFTNTFKMVECSTPAITFQMACAYYVASVKAYGLDNTVLLCPMRDKSEINVGVFNRNLQHLLNPKSEGDFTMKIGDTEFRKGDKIMQMKNTEFIKNGDIGYITDIVCEKKNEDDDADDDSAETEIHVVIDFDGLECRYREEDMMNVGLAYCTTIHKCQGSEYETVIMVVSNMHEVMLRRNLIYTGITRAEKNVAIIGEESALKKAIYNDKTDKRYTLLGDRLHAML